MRPGLMEIGVIALVILIIFVMTRIMRRGQNAGSMGGTSHGKGDVVKAGRTRNSSLRNTGIVLVVIGSNFLLFCASFLRWFFGAYIGALVIIALGVVIIFIARRK